MRRISHSRRLVYVLVAELGLFAAVIIVCASVLLFSRLPSKTATPTGADVPAERLSTPTPTGTNVSTGIGTDVPAERRYTPTATPTLEPPARTDEPPARLFYTIQVGDTLSQIALRFGVSVEALKAANNLQDDLIYAGRVLLIPPGGTPVSLASPTAEPTQAGSHIVAAGETLDDIATQYQITTAALRAINFMYGDAILPGQRLAITTTTAITPTAWQYSIIDGNLPLAYPLSLETDRFTLHYTPGTFPAIDPQSVAYLVEVGLATIERVYAAQLAGHFDAYVAGTVFEPPSQALRGRSFSVDRYYFFLHDGTGNAADQQYIATHELTHLFSWNVFGYHGSTMLSEGAAVYIGMEAIAGSGHLPLKSFCAAYLQAGKLPRVTSSLSFQGHIYDLQNYYTAGCFVGYLIETFGPQKFGQNYSVVNYEVNYGKTLWALEEAWRSSLATVALPETLDPARLVQGVKDVEVAYQSLFPVFRARPEQLEAYRELDEARLALLEGRLDEMDQRLAAFRKILNP